MPGQVPTREIYLNLPMWAQVVFYVVSGIASLIFLWGFWRRIKKYRQGRADHRFDRMGRRIKRAVNIDMTSIEFCTDEMIERSAFHR